MVGVNHEIRFKVTISKSKVHCFAPPPPTPHILDIICVIKRLNSNFIFFNVRLLVKKNIVGYYLLCGFITSMKLVIGVITPNQIPLTTIVTYLHKRYRSRISNHWATIPACSVVPPIYKQFKKTYCHVSF